MGCVLLTYYKHRFSMQEMKQYRPFGLADSVAIELKGLEDVMD
jgi:hypothetical protein